VCQGVRSEAALPGLVSWALISGQGGWALPTLSHPQEGKALFYLWKVSGTPRPEGLWPGTTVPRAFPLIRAEQGPPGRVETEDMDTFACVFTYPPVVSRPPGECTRFCGVLFFEWEIGDPSRLPLVDGGLSLRG